MFTKFLYVLRVPFLKFMKSPTKWRRKWKGARQDAEN